MVNGFRMALFGIVMPCCFAFVPAGPDAACAQTAPQDGPNLPALETLLPDPGALGGCAPTSPPLFFNRGTLWDYINGAADAYLRYGFEQLLVSQWTTTKDSTRLTIEIYRMESPDHAFGIYSAERSPDDPPIAIDVDGYQGTYFLNFWKGPHYVKLSSMRSSKSAGKALLDLATAVSASIPGRFDPPELFRFFPAEGRIERSERFVPDNFLGHAFLKNGHLLEYRRDDNRYHLFLADIESSIAATKAFEDLREFLASAGQSPSCRRRSDVQILVTKTGARQVVFQFQSYVGGVLGLEDVRRAEALVETVVERLAERSPNRGKK